MRIPGRHWLLVPPLLALLAGCQAPPRDRPLTSEVPQPPAFAAPPEACLAEGVRFALGQRISAPLLEEMRQRSGARVARTLAATDPSDAQRDAGRLNVRVDASGRIVAASCQ